MAEIAGIRSRVRRGRSAIILGDPPKPMRFAVRQTRAMMRDLTALVVKVHGHTSIHHLQLISEWAEAEVSRRLLWMEFRDKYPHKLTTEQVCLVRKDTQRYAAEKSRCIRELNLDMNKASAYEAALADDSDPELTEAEVPEGYKNTAEAFSTTCATGDAS